MIDPILQQCSRQPAEDCGLNITGHINSTYFKKSVTGETLFFFGVLPWPPTWTGHIVTSEEDVARIGSYLKTYQWVTNLVLVPAGTTVVMLWTRYEPSSWAPDSDFLPELLFGLVTAVAVAVACAFVFGHFVLDPILRKYPISQERITYRELREARAATTSRGKLLGAVVVALLILGIGVALLLWGKDAENRITGTLLILGAGMIAVWTARTVRLKRQLKDREQWRVT